MLDYQMARHIYDSIKGSDQVALRRELLSKATDYSNVRSQWLLASLEQRKAMDQRRTITHNSFIDSCNIMSRNMGLKDEDNTWRADLGDDRKIIGDLACFIQLFMGLEAR